MKSFHRNILAAAAFAVAASVSSAITIEFGSAAPGSTVGLLSTGATLGFSGSGVNVTASAWSNSSASGGTFNAARLGQYDPGLGVTNTNNDSDHEVDNIGTFDFVLLSFSQIVDVQSIRLENVGNDSDLQVWYGNNSALSSLYAGSSLVNTGGDDPRTADLSSGDVIGQYILIGARASFDDDDDTFKIRNVTFNPVNRTPDGGSTLLMLGLGVAGLGFATRRKKSV